MGVIKVLLSFLIVKIKGEFSMDKSLFIKKDIRKTIKIKNKKGKFINFKLYNYNEASKKAVFDMYKKKNKQGLDDFSLSEYELVMVFKLFTHIAMSIDELSEIIENPNFYFEQIFNEIELILSELVVLFIQEKEKEVAKFKIDEALLNMQETIVSNVGDING